MADLISFWGVCSIILLLVGFGGVAFITLLERKLLGLSQIRLGPNKVTFLGILQPLADGVKLLFKHFILVSKGQRLLFLLAPILLILLFILLWGWVIPWSPFLFFCKYNRLVLFCLLGVGAYSVILVGWSSVRVFSKLGCMRGILQRLAFEVSLILLFMVVLSVFSSLGFFYRVGSLGLLVFWALLWVAISLIERNRAPFDLLEGERELISGFNVEMGRLRFVYIFLREYGMLIILSLILGLVQFKRVVELSLIFIILFLFIRSCFPRVRWDLMITFIWQRFLPVAVFLFILRSFFSV